MVLKKPFVVHEELIVTKLDNKLPAQPVEATAIKSPIY
jgi:hypothetical protein